MNLDERPGYAPKIGSVDVGAVTDEYEIIFCLDPSPDRTEAVILQHRQKDQRMELDCREFGSAHYLAVGEPASH